MLPSYWLSLEALPKNLNGKIDRRKLRERFEREAQAAASAEEALLCEHEPQPPDAGRATDEPPSAPAREHAQAGTGALADRLAHVPQAEWDAVVLEVVQTQAAALLAHLTTDAIEPDRAFKDLGLDSLGAVELSSRLAEATGLQLAPTLIFDHPTPAAVASCCARRWRG